MPHTNFDLFSQCAKRNEQIKIVARVKVNQTCEEANPRQLGLESRRRRKTGTSRDSKRSRSRISKARVSKSKKPARDVRVNGKPEAAAKEVDEESEQNVG
jgi:hypothetical protein